MLTNKDWYQMINRSKIFVVILVLALLSCSSTSFGNREHHNTYEIKKISNYRNVYDKPEKEEIKAIPLFPVKKEQKLIRKRTYTKKTENNDRKKDSLFLRNLENMKTELLKLQKVLEDIGKEKDSIND